jgi:hypothetical protein
LAKPLEKMPPSKGVIEFNEKSHRYKVDGVYFPSVTTIIDSVVPKNLSWWAMVIGVRATTELIKKGIVTEFTDPEEIVTEIRNQKLSVYHIRDEKGEEGTAVHRALENYASHGEIPDLGAYTPVVRPKIRALAAWLLSYRPVILASEVRVASTRHGYAGTFDLRVKEPGTGRVGIIDLKTGKRIYPDSQYPQLAAYEQASVESGYDPSDFQAILHLTEDGEYSFVESTDTFEDFEVLLNHYMSMKMREQRIKEES